MDKDVEPNDNADGLVTAIHEVGVIGAGQMGGGIAHVVALAGYNVILNDLERARFDGAIEIIRKNMTRQVSRGLIESDEAEKAIGRISFGDSFKAFGDSDLVLEAATEDESVKRLIFQRPLPASEGRRDCRLQHLVDLDHTPRRFDRPAGTVHRHSLHEPGAADAARRADPWHRYRRSDLHAVTRVR